jgi:hypothetical protein
MQRSSISRDSVRRSGETGSITVNGEVIPGPPFIIVTPADYEYEIISTVIPTGVFTLQLACASADAATSPDRDAPIIGGPYTSSTLALHVVANTTTGNTFWNVEKNGLTLGPFLTVGPGAVGIFSLTTVGGWNGATDTLGLGVNSATGVGTMTVRARIRLQ